MAKLVKAVREQARRTFESREYRNFREEIRRKLEERRRHLIEGLSQRAKKRGVAVSFTPMGAVLGALSADAGVRPMSAEEVELLPEEERARMRERGEEFSPVISEILDQIRRLEREAHEVIVDQDARVARNAIAPLVRECQCKYQEQPRIADYLNWVQEDLIARTEAIRSEVGDEDEAGEKPRQSNVSLETI